MLRKVLTQTYQEIAADTVFSDVVPQLNKIMDLLNKNTGPFNEDEWLERFMAEMAFFDKLLQVTDDPRLKIFQNKLRENIKKANLVYDEITQDRQTYLTMLERLRSKIENDRIAEQDKIDKGDARDKNHCDNDGRESWIKLLTMISLALNDFISSRRQFRDRLANTGITIKRVEQPLQLPLPINDPNLGFIEVGRSHWPVNYTQSDDLFFLKKSVEELVKNKAYLQENISGPKI